MIHPKLKASRILLPVFLIVLFLLLLIWVSYFRQRSIDRENSIRFGVQRNSNLAVAFEQYAIRTLRSADAILQMIRMEYTDGDTLNLEELMMTNKLGRDMMKGVVIINKDGRLEKSSLTYPRDSVPGFSDRSFFIFHQNNAGDSLLVSRSDDFSVPGKPAVVLSRKLRDKNDRFRGVVAMLVRPSAFTSFYAQAHLLPNDILSLIAPDGLTYARRTGRKESSGENIAGSPLFQLVAQQPDSFYFAPDAIRGIPTWFSYRRFRDYPMIATVGSSEADILAGFRSRQGLFILPRIIISVLVVIIALVTARMLLHRRKVLERLKAEKENYQRLLTEQMITVQEREREWIGRELHDNVNQVLTTVKLLLETVSKENDHPLIPRSMSLISNSISDIRHLSHQLSAPTLGTRSLLDSINALVDNFALSTSIRFTFIHAGYTDRVAMRQKLALYRILQEQLNNIVKHAEATEVRISLHQCDGEVVLTVEDNGRGFDPDAKIEGMGINNMISRARVFDGDVQVSAEPGKGCRLTVSMPFIPFVK